MGWTSFTLNTFSSEATVSYSKYRSLPRSFSTMPQVSITVPNASPTGGTATVLFGQERSRQSNQLAVDTWTGFFAGNLYLGDHEVKFGAEEYLVLSARDVLAVVVR